MRRLEWERQREQERNGETVQHNPPSSPTIDLPVPFSNFYVELKLNHPYWSEFRGKLGAPEFSRYDPSINDYMQKYQESVGRLHAAAVDFMQMICPGAEEIQTGGI